MRLTLVRHAKSSWSDPDLHDFERPLNARGRLDAPRMAALMQRELPPPDGIATSPALRAITTARVFAEVLGFDPNHLLIVPRIYEASAEQLLTVVRGFDDRHPHMMLFGHNPGLSDLAALLADVPFVTLPTCGLVHLEFALPHWQQIVPRSGRLLAYHYPKGLSD